VSYSGVGVERPQLAQGCGSEKVTAYAVEGTGWKLEASYFAKESGIRMVDRENEHVVVVLVEDLSAEQKLSGWVLAPALVLDQEQLGSEAQKGRSRLKFDYRVHRE